MTATITIPDPAGAGEHPLFREEHEALRAALRAFVEREITPHVDEWEQTTFPDSIVRRMGELGFLGLSVPEEYGGQGGDYFTNLVLAEEMGRSGCGGLLMGLSVHTDMVIPPLLQFGTEEQKRAWVTPGVRGEKMYCLGITEPDAGSDVAGIRTRAARDGDDWVINGSKTYITNGIRADMCLLVTKTDPDAGHHGFTLFLVPMDSPGVIRAKKLSKMGMHASDTALLAFDDVRLPGSAVLGQVGRGFFHIMWELQAERLIGAAGCLAYARYAFDKTVAFATERFAFGQPIGSFQAIRHKIAEMALKYETGRALTYNALRLFHEGHDAVKEVTMAKLQTQRDAFDVADEALQIHGGAGYMKEYEVERAARDTRLGPIGGGTDEIMKEILGKQLGL